MAQVSVIWVTWLQLQVLWNLHGDAAFIIQKKLQSPILFNMNPDLKPETFYDDTHEKSKSPICKLYKNRWLDLLQILVTFLFVVVVLVLLFQLSILLFSKEVSGFKENS